MAVPNRFPAVGTALSAMSVWKNVWDGKKDSFNLLLKTWYRIPEDEDDDDNPDLSSYVGYGELWGMLYWKTTDSL